MPDNVQTFSNANMGNVSPFMKKDDPAPMTYGDPMPFDGFGQHFFMHHFHHHMHHHFHHHFFQPFGGY